MPAQYLIYEAEGNDGETVIVEGQIVMQSSSVLTFEQGAIDGIQIAKASALAAEVNWTGDQHLIQSFASADGPSVTVHSRRPAPGKVCATSSAGGR